VVERVLRVSGAGGGEVVVHGGPRVCVASVLLACC